LYSVGAIGNWQGDEEFHYLYETYEYEIWELALALHWCGI